jgi:two-component system invasion response regulator UvrY
MIRIFVIEDHATVIVSGLRYLFRPNRDGIAFTGFAPGLEEAVTVADPETFDLFLLDLYLPGTLPVNNIRRLKSEFPEKPVIIYTSETSAFWKQKMLEEGAMAYVTKNSPREELFLAFQKASRGEYYFPGLPAAGKPDAAQLDQATPVDAFSPVQLDILQRLSEGKSHKEIAIGLGLSLSRIEKILIQLRKQHKTRNNFELINLLYRTQ